VPIIDFRCRPNTPEYMGVGPGPEDKLNALKWERWGVTEPAPVPLDEFISMMDFAGIDMGVFTGRQIGSIKDGLAFGISNEYLAECVKRYPDRLVAFTGVDMSLGEESAAEVRRTVEEYGFKGVSLDPRMTNTLPDDKAAYPIYEVAQELGIPVVFTMGPIVAKFGDPYRLDQPAIDFPDLNFVCSHAPWPHVNEFLALAYRRPNIYLEPSIYWNLPGNGALFEAANGILVDQILYGSGHPFQPLQVVDAFKRQINWSKESWEKISYKNAARLLKLDNF
jgi:predicted TIM-barrel fold metal-dependent hydrolase